MSDFHPRYIVDEKGSRREVVLAIEDYEELIERANDALDAAEIERLRGEPLHSWAKVKRERAVQGRR